MESGEGVRERGGWRSTFFGFQLLQHPRLLALFAVGFRLHVLSQIPWKEMRTDSWPGGRERAQRARAHGGNTQLPACSSLTSAKGWGGAKASCALVSRHTMQP